jgi:hypothetical protein
MQTRNLPGGLARDGRGDAILAGADEKLESGTASRLPT